MNTTSRRLEANTPAWGDFVSVCGVAFILLILLRVLYNISWGWKRKMIAKLNKVIEEREKVKDPFRTKNGHSWDMVIMFKINEYNQKKQQDLEKDRSKYEECKSKSLKTVLHKLANAGLETKLFYSVQHDEVYVKIRCSLKRLKDEADRIEYSLLLEAASINNALKLGGTNKRSGLKWAPVTIPEKTMETSIPPCEFISAPFQQSNKHSSYLYKKYGDNSIFRSADRVKLIHSIITARIEDGGANIQILRNIVEKDNDIMAYFPLHDLVELRTLEEKWLRYCQAPWRQRVDIVKDYFGEKIAFYFLFLGHYTSWLISSASLGFISWIVVAAKNNDPNTVWMPFFAAFLSIWSTLMLEYWKRREKRYAMQWGMVGFEAEEPTRAEFEGVLTQSAVDGSPVYYYPRLKRYWKFCNSVLVIFAFVIVVVSSIAGIFVLRLLFTREPYSSELTVGTIQLGSIITSLLNAVNIQVFNFVYGAAAIYLTDFENHRKNTEYEDSLVVKTFLFQFVNSYISLYYIAFVKPFIPMYDPCNGSCLKEIQTTLGTIFLTRLATASIASVVAPYITSKMTEAKEMKGVENEHVSEVERSAIQPEYHPILGTFTDFSGVVIQYGYTTMFIAAFPLATVMSFINNYVQMRVDAWKLCQLFRRPLPQSREDIGSWYHILEIMALVAVFVNAALVAFTSTVVDDFTWNQRIWIFIGMSCGIFIMKYLLSIVIPDTPREVEIQIERREFIVGKLFKNIVDEDNSAGTFKKKPPEFTIRITDDDPM